MRRIEQAMCQAIRLGRNWKEDNTEVRQVGKEAHVLLFNNLIAVFSDEKSPKWTLAGWNTKTTRNRLNALANEFTWPYAIVELHGAPFMYSKDGSRHPIDDRKWYDALTGKEIEE